MLSYVMIKVYMFSDEPQGSLSTFHLAVIRRHRNIHKESLNLLIIIYRHYVSILIRQIYHLRENIHQTWRLMDRSRSSRIDPGLVPT